MIWWRGDPGLAGDVCPDNRAKLLKEWIDLRISCDMLTWGEYNALRLMPIFRAISCEQEKCFQCVVREIKFTFKFFFA